MFPPCSSNGSPPLPLPPPPVRPPMSWTSILQVRCRLDGGHGPGDPHDVPLSPPPPDSATPAPWVSVLHVACDQALQESPSAEPEGSVVLWKGERLFCSQGLLGPLTGPHGTACRPPTWRGHSGAPASYLSGLSPDHRHSFQFPTPKPT